MPELSRFHGIVIYMYFRDHAPPHFHAQYGEFEITIEIESGVITGQFPRNALMLVTEWYSLHKTELASNWILSRQQRPLRRIEPLDR
jgi:hypothetical protein